MLIQHERTAGSTESIAIATVLGLPVLTEDNTEAKRELLARLTASYKLDYFDTNSIHFHGARDLYRRAVEKGWTEQEFFARLDYMTETVKFPTWTPADFFSKPRAEVYHRSWMLKELKEDPHAAKKMQFYRVHGKGFWCRYTPTDGSVLPNPFELISQRAKDVYAIPERKVTQGQSKKIEVQVEEKKSERDEFLRETLRAKSSLEVESAQQQNEIRRLMLKTTEQERLIERQQKVIEDLKNQIYTLTEVAPYSAAGDDNFNFGDGDDKEDVPH